MTAKSGVVASAAEGWKRLKPLYIKLGILFPFVVVCNITVTVVSVAVQPVFITAEEILK